MRRVLLSVTIAVASVLTASAATAPAWEEVTAPSHAITQTIDRESETEVTVHDGYIYLYNEKEITVKIFSILGQLIIQENVKPGIHRIKLTSRGIYILRAGTTTRRITI